jgi:hypothetical protein
MAKIKGEKENFQLPYVVHKFWSEYWSFNFFYCSNNGMSKLLKRVNESKLKILWQWHVRISKESRWKNEPMKSMMGWEKDVTPPSWGRLKFANPNFT